MFLHTTPFVLTPNSTRREKFDDGVTIVTYGSKWAGHLFSGEKGQEKAKKKFLEKVFRPPYVVL